LKKKILIVEDDPMLMKMMQIILDEYNLLVAADGMMAVKMAKEEAPHIILMDLTLPLLDGYEALQEIRAFSETITVIAMTAKHLLPK